ncbi:MAG: sigma factor [Minicystis sp.]
MSLEANLKGWLGTRPQGLRGTFHVKRGTGRYSMAYLPPMTRRRSPRRTWRLTPIRRRPRLAPSIEELAVALALWTLVELLPQEGEIGREATKAVQEHGIDVQKRYRDIYKITAAHFGRCGLDLDDLVQDVCAMILARNRGASAFDPSKSSFSHYVFLQARNAVANALEKQKRWRREVLADTPLDPVDERDPIAAFETIYDSPRVSKGRPLDRSKVREGRSVMN